MVDTPGLRDLAVAAVSRTSLDDRDEVIADTVLAAVLPAHRRQVVDEAATLVDALADDWAGRAIRNSLNELAEDTLRSAAGQVRQLVETGPAAPATPPQSPQSASAVSQPTPDVLRPSERAALDPAARAVAARRNAPGVDPGDHIAVSSRQWAAITAERFQLEHAVDGLADAANRLMTRLVEVEAERNRFADRFLTEYDAHTSAMVELDQARAALAVANVPPVPLAEILDALRDEEALRAWYRAQHPYSCLSVPSMVLTADYLADRFGPKEQP